MTTAQKQQIEHLRRKGESYSSIAAALGIFENTVKSYCRRNNLGAGFKAKQDITKENLCKNCGNPLEYTPGAKKKRFCSDKCRMAWWNSHPEAVRRKAIYHFRCKSCGAPFESYGNAHRKYCSRTCFAAARSVAR